MKLVLNNNFILIALIIASTFTFAFFTLNSNALAPFAGAPIPDTAVTNFPTVNGLGFTSEIAPDGSVYVGGQFQAAGGQIQTGFAGVDTINSSSYIDFPSADNEIKASAPDGNGGWYIGGNFTKIDTTTRNRMAHILSDGTLDAFFDPSFDSDVRSIIYDEANNLIYVGGSFVSVNTNATPLARQGVAAINATTGVATAFDPSIGGNVESLALDNTNGLLYAGGAFNNVNNSTTPVTRNEVAAFDISTSLVTSFDPDISDAVAEIVLDEPNDILYIGGSFSNVNVSTTNTARDQIAGIDTTTGVVTSFDPSLQSSPETIALDSVNDILYVGGGFEQVNVDATPVTRNAIAGFSTSTSIATSFDAELDSSDIVEDIVVDEVTHNIYVAGQFLAVNNISGILPRTNIAEFNTTTSVATSFSPLFSAISLRHIGYDSANDSIIVSGTNLTGVGGTRRNNFLHILADGSLDPNFNPDFNEIVTDAVIDIPSNTIYIAGDFTKVNVGTTPASRRNLAAFDLTTGALKSFDAAFPSGSGINSLVFDGINDILYVGGSFSAVNDDGSPLTRNNIVALNAITGAATSFDPDTLGGVYDLKLNSTGTILYASGQFSSVNQNTTPVPRGFIAGFTTSDGIVTAFDPSVNAFTPSLAVSEDDSIVYAAGNFTSVNTGGTPLVRNRIAAFDSTTGIATSFDPDLNGNGLNIELDDPKDILYIGGTFTSINNSTTPVSAQGMAAVDTATGISADFLPSYLGPLFSFSIDPTSERVYVAGALYSAPVTTAFLGGLAVYGLEFAAEVQETTTTTTSVTTTTSPGATTTSPSVASNGTVPQQGTVSANGSLPITGKSLYSVIYLATLLICFGFAIKINRKKKLIS